MKKKIAILGSTGSIGKAALSIIKSDIYKYEIILLSANKNFDKISEQINKFKTQYFII
jgi:1-deoxy-D-xylulose 5-phosphate reductoisomerase